MMTKRFYSTLFLVITLCSTAVTHANPTETAVAPLFDLGTLWKTYGASATKTGKAAIASVMKQYVSEKLAESLFAKESTDTSKALKKQLRRERLQELATQFSALQAKTDLTALEMDAMIKELDIALAQNKQTISPEPQDITIA